MNQTAPSYHPKYVGADGVFLTAEWQHLVMLNYEVDAGLLLPFTQPELNLIAGTNKPLSASSDFDF